MGEHNHKKEQGQMGFSKRKIQPHKHESKPLQYKFDKSKQKDHHKVSSYLSSMYRHKDGKPVNMSQFHRKSSSTKKIVFTFLFLFLLFILFASWTSFQMFSGNVAMKFDEEKIQFSIQGPQTIATGQSVTYVLHYQNLGHTPLEEGQISIQYPSGFLVQEIDPPVFTKEQTVFDLSTIAPLDQDRIRIKGIIIGEPNSQKSFSATLSYVPKGFNFTFQKYASLMTEMTSSLITAEFKGPAQAIIGEQMTYQFTYQNTSGNALHDVRFLLDIPQQFSVESITPEIEKYEGKFMYRVDVLPNDTFQTLQIKGVFDKANKISPGIYPLKALVELKADQDIYVTQQEQIFEIQVLGEGPFINIHLNNQDASAYVNPGQTIHMDILYENKGQQEMKDVVILLKMESPFLDWTSLKDQSDGLVSQNAITWTKQEIAVLERLRPQAKGRIPFQINVKDFAKLKELPSSQLEQASFAIFVEMKESDSSSHSQIMQGNKTVYLNGHILAQSHGAYYDSNGSPIGEGPLPPIAGAKTTYQIVWEIQNTFHPLQDVSVVSRLPIHSNFEGIMHVSHGNLSFDQSQKRVVWNIQERITSNETVKAVFSVSITPQLEHVDKTMVIMTAADIIAKDALSGGNIQKTLPVINTTIPNDSFATGTGLVRY